MINWEKLDAQLNAKPELISFLLTNVKAEVKYLKSHGLNNVSEEELGEISELRAFAKAYGIFSESHPILEDDLNLLNALERVA